MTLRTLSILLLLLYPSLAAAQSVFAAASLSSALSELAIHYEGMRLSVASSSTLAKQIASGAPADIYFSANAEWMDYLQARQHIEQDTRVDLLGNALVVIAPKGEPFAVRWARDFDFASAFAGRLALGDPDHVPAGQYARQALAALGWWPALKTRIAPAPDVRAALVYVERGECAAGLSVRHRCGSKRPRNNPSDRPGLTAPPHCLSSGHRQGPRQCTDPQPVGIF